MATFLSGVQDFAREVGIDPGPTDVTTQIGELNRLVEWYRQAWIEIQNRTRWRWMRRPFTLTTVASTETYTFADCTDVIDAVPITRFKEWRLNDREDPPRIYLQAAGVGGERWLNWVPWNWYKMIYRVNMQNPTTPAHIAIDPQDQINLGPKPNDIYIVSGDYYLSPQTLTAFDDVPEMPAHFHALIMYEAMKKYAYYESAQEVLTRAEDESEKLVRQLQREQGPVWRMAGAMA